MYTERPDGFNLYATAPGSERLDLFMCKAEPGEDSAAFLYREMYYMSFHSSCSTSVTYPMSPILSHQQAMEICNELAWEQTVVKSNKKIFKQRKRLIIPTTWTTIDSNLDSESSFIRKPGESFNYWRCISARKCKYDCSSMQK